MPCHRASRPVDDPRVYLAAERTFLAWVRTSVSLMGFGFVIARFALWTREYRLRGSTRRGRRPGRGSRPGSGSAWFVWGLRLPSWPRLAIAIMSVPWSGASPTRLLHIKTSLIVAGTLALVGLAIAVHILML